MGRTVWVIAQDEHMTFENALVVEHLRQETPWREFHIAHALVAQVFRMEGDDVMRSLIVNADDLGLTIGVNDGIFDAHDHDPDQRQPVRERSSHI